MTAPLAPNAACPRCGGAFHCGVDDATPCACTAPVLAPEQLRQLQAQYDGCLCLHCLRQLAQEPRPSVPPGR